MKVKVTDEVNGNIFLINNAICIVSDPATRQVAIEESNGEQYFNFERYKVEILDQHA